MSNQNQQAIHALKTATQSENILHFDNNHSTLQDVNRALSFVEYSLESHDKNTSINGDDVASVLRLVNKEVAYLQDELERHFDDVETIHKPQNKEVEK